MTAGFPQSEKATKMGITVFYNPILKVRYHHHSCPILLVTQTIPGTVRGLQKSVNTRRQAAFQAILDTGYYLDLLHR